MRRAEGAWTGTGGADGRCGPAAGVATVTVSRVLHEADKVAPATRARVEAAIAELGYLPNLVARSLVAARTGMVAALIPTIDNSLHAEMIQGMDGAARPPACIS
ncbi:MAG: LacI family DNA-binding transcriptional regulator [Geminicoccaceae bacterium]